MNTEASASPAGVSFLGLLFLTFLVLKLTHVIDWSWWFVTMPLWIGLALLLVALVLGFLIFMARFIYRNLHPRRTRATGRRK